MRGYGGIALSMASQNRTAQGGAGRGIKRHFMGHESSAAQRRVQLRRRIGHWSAVPCRALTVVCGVWWVVVYVPRRKSLPGVAMAMRIRSPFSSTALTIAAMITGKISVEPDFSAS